MNTFYNIHDWLRKATRGLVENRILTPRQVESRARWLVDDIAAIGFREFQVLGLRELKCLANGRDITIPLVEYGFGEKRNDIENADPEMSRPEIAKIRCMEGTGLDRGDLAFFAQICEIGRCKLPKLWLSSKNLRQDLALHTKHLSTLNEVWWLDLWQTLDPDEIKHEARINLNSLSTIDWVFPLRGTAVAGGSQMWINLEVKQLLSTFTTRVHGDVEPIEDLFRGVEDKFRRSRVDEINVVALTIMCEVNDSVEQLVNDRLDADDLLDVVCIWSPFAKRHSFVTRFNPRLKSAHHFKRGVVEASLRGSRPEDDARVYLIKHPDLTATEQLFGKRQG